MSTATAKRKTRHVRKRIDRIWAAPENESVYRPIREDDPEIIALAESIRKHGVQEPLVVSADGWILSGHRRRVAAELAGLQTVPCRIHHVRRDKNPAKFLTLLREFNRQRVKGFEEKLHEEIVSTDANEPYGSLLDYRIDRFSDVDAMEIKGRKTRSDISEAKYPMLNAVLGILRRFEKFWPVSLRFIHYKLLDDPPLRHAGKLDSHYRNTKTCYGDLSDLVTRARLQGMIGWAVIKDETRPVIVWNTHKDVGAFIRKELDGFLKNYWRDLQQSQPYHIEIVGEKSTLTPFIQPVAMRYCIPYTLGRGFASLPPRHDMVERFEKSGKRKMVIIFLTDFDPDGEEIAQSFARSIRDDFGVDNVVAVKAALTAEQVVEYQLPPVMKAKQSSPNYDKFTIEHGEDVFEIDAVADRMDEILGESIDRLLDTDAFNYELGKEEAEAASLQKTRKRVQAALAEIMGEIT